MSDNAMEFLVQWFIRQCDGDWEHGVGIRIETLDNPGWSLDIRIEDTSLEGIVEEWSAWERDETNWLHWRSTGTTFQARCGPGDLNEALAAFQSFAVERESVGGIMKSTDG